MEQYIEDKKILGVTVIEGEFTPAKNSMVKVMFEDGTMEIMPKLRLELICSDTPMDATAVQNKINRDVGATLFGTLHEYGIKMGEVEPILNAASDYTNAGYEKARDIKWGVRHRFLPLLEINKILVEENAKENINGTSSTGSGSDSENKG